MRRSLITLREYERLPYDQLGKEEVRALERLTENLDIEAFRFFRSELQARQYVGLVQTPEHTIQILPKVHENDDVNLGYLLLLLSYTRTLNLYPVGTAQLKKLAGSFLEVWIRHFAQMLNRLLRRQYRRDYVEVESATGFLRGKLLIEELRGDHEAATGRYPCRFEVFTSDHLLYQVLKFCNNLLRRETKSPATQSLLRENAGFLVDVSDRVVHLSDIDRIHLNRLNRAYAPLLDFCRLLLSRSTLNVRVGQVAQLAFLFDMNRLFEEFVAEFLRRHAHRIKINGRWPLKAVKPQYRLGRLFGEFRMQVDLLLIDEVGHRILLDTKYKALDAVARHSGLAQSDFYQMYAYAKAGKEEYDHVMLLYPETSEIDNVYRSESATLYVRTFDLRRIYDAKSGQVEVNRTLRKLTKALRIEVTQSR